PWLREVGVAERRPVRTSRDVRSGRSSRPQHRRVLCFPHRRLWIMQCSCKVWCRPCRRRPTPRLSWRLRPLALPVARRVRWSNTLKRRRLRRRDLQLRSSDRTRRKWCTRHSS
ncbi:hypothetical protein Taro_015175, partial [Colocasia esculenta]|nr:hypothetical protein [Colocasia esculenta]